MSFGSITFKRKQTSWLLISPVLKNFESNHPVPGVSNMQPIQGSQSEIYSVKIYSNSSNEMRRRRRRESIWTLYWKNKDIKRGGFCLSSESDLW